MSFFDPVEIDGYKFDRAMTLFEFSALREPEATRFPHIGEWLRGKGIEFNEVPTPKMYWRGKFWHDLFISNQLEALGDFPEFWNNGEYPLLPKQEWRDDLDLKSVSDYLHGRDFHAAFIEPMCRKIAGVESPSISAKFHRSIWLPLFWPQTLRARKSIRTPFYYPRAGTAYAGINPVCNDRNYAPSGERPIGHKNYESTALSVAFILARPAHPFSVLFVVDDSPIYRITDMDVCAGTGADWHRWIVEYRGDLLSEHLVPFGASSIGVLGRNEIKFTLPSIANVQRGWRPRPHLNDKLWEAMQREAADTSA